VLKNPDTQESRPLTLPHQDQQQRHGDSDRDEAGPERLGLVDAVRQRQPPEADRRRARQECRAIERGWQHHAQMLEVRAVGDRGRQ
jgi:hypothetical protein